MGRPSTRACLSNHCLCCTSHRRCLSFDFRSTVKLVSSALVWRSHSNVSCISSWPCASVAFAPWQHWPKPGYGSSNGADRVGFVACCYIYARTWIRFMIANMTFENDARLSAFPKSTDWRAPFKLRSNNLRKVGGSMRLLLILLSLVSSVCHAAESDEIDSFLASFYADFSDHKIDRLSNNYFYPGAQAVFGEHVTILSSNDDVRGMFTAILDGLDKKGYKQSVVKQVSKTKLGKSYAFVTVLFDRISIHGNRIDSTCSSYSLIKLAGEWRFLSWIPTEPLPNGTCK